MVVSLRFGPHSGKKRLTFKQIPRSSLDFFAILSGTVQQYNIIHPGGGELYSFYNSLNVSQGSLDMREKFL